MKLKGIQHSWGETVLIMNIQKSVTTTIESKKQTVHIRQCNEPAEQVEEIYRKLKYTSNPFPLKNSCGTLMPVLKCENRLSDKYEWITARWVKNKTFGEL